MNESLTVLAVDDEPINLSILCCELEDLHYRVLTARDGEEAWDVVQAYGDEVALILLDRMMPHLDGIGFMHRLLGDETLRHIPVIMQTAAAQEEQIAEGVEAGVYYYLTKPFNSEFLASIVKAAIHDSRYRRHGDSRPVPFSSALPRLRSAVFEIRTLEECQYLAAMLANYYPDPEAARLGVGELLLNAVEHGNLGIGCDEKTELLVKDLWRQEIIARLARPENQEKYVRVALSIEPGAIHITITDQGCGFRWHDYLDFVPARMTQLNGRGIAIASRMCFDIIAYNDAGNEVTATVTSGV